MTNAPAFLTTLTRLFQEGHALVFWNDADGEFSSQVNGIDIEGVKILRLDQTPALQAKIWIEREVGARWLVYAPFEEPEPAQDWLLDARLRGKPFSADTASMQIDELGLTTRSLRDHLKARAKFLRARDRFERIKRWVQPQDTAEDLDRKMLAAVAKSETADPSAIFLKVFDALAAEGVELGARTKALDELATYEIEEAFWALVEREFGYKESGKELPTLRGLLYCIFATDFCNGVGNTPLPLAHFVIEARAKAAQVSVFASRWRTDMANYGSYDALSSQVAEELRIMDILGPMHAEELADAMTFEGIEKRVIGDLKARIIAGRGANMDSAREIIARRRDGHWANPLLAGANASTRALAASYDALEAAAGFFELQAKHGHGFSFPDARAAFEAYRSDLHQFDQLYRWFMRATESVEPMGWALLHELRERMEDAYSGWFVGQLASAWGAVVEGSSGLLSTWKLDGVANQQDFYLRHVAPAFDGGAKRVFVVVSDAFRYEAAAELVGELNARSRVTARLDAMLGVLPSYTALGMASLLPHERLAYKGNVGLDVTVDGQPSSTLEQRSAIVAAHGGVAIGRDAIMEKGKEKGREFVKPYKVVYVYHDVIDMVGDKRGSETKTFEATAQAIKELSELVSFIVNNLNGSTIFVTADHGFLYQESALDEADRSTVEEGMPGVLKPKKRYILGRGMRPMQNAWSGNTETTAGTDAGVGSVDFLVPKGAGRFHFVGGARFVHGSAMPQEIVVPVVVVKESESEKAKTKVVEVSLLGSSNKVVTNKQRFEFIQNEAVSERVLPVTLLFTIRDGDKPVSDEQAVTFDSASPMLDERKRSLMMTLAGGSYDRNKDYFLVARDAKTKAEAWRATLRIDLAFSNDF
ncbi:BREX-1 system phosphatase PglZ type A [Caballeronia humi]|uniref:Alkaline phosphatase domain-containing protein n=1 Tax=Caballeronia humi TaxID=326474 RepID=A0A158IT02_9BURK|nr:BREX-1 system phosphatase PglZ type A [Caballeronia humi]SAL59764.1 alkaline phosphatase domain-containing protein [Caballeronia humi]